MGAKVQEDLQLYWSLKNEIEMIDSIAMKGKRVIISASLQGKVLIQLHIIHMGIEGKLLVHESIYWITVNADVEDTVKTALLDLQATQPNDKTMQDKRQGRLWESVRAYIFSINEKHYPCLVGYHRKFLVIKWVDGLSTDNLIQMCKVIFSEYALPNRIESDAGSNFVSQKFENFCKWLSILQPSKQRTKRSMHKTC